MKKRIFLLLLVLLVLLVGCGSVTESPGKEQTQEGDIAPEQTLTVSVCYGFTASDLQIAAKRFEAQRPGVKVEIVSYDGDTSGYQQQVTTQLLSGTATDVIDATNFSEIALADSGLLADIYPLMENDADFSMDDYFEQAIEAMRYKGKLVVFPSQFYYTLIGVNSGFSPGLTEAFAQLDTVNYWQMLELHKAFAGAEGPWLSQSFDAAYVMDQSMSAFVDFENKSCFFDTPEFIQFLSDAKNATDPEKIAKGEMGYSYDGSFFREDMEAYAQKYLFSGADWQQSQAYLDFAEPLPFTHYIPITDKAGNLVVLPWHGLCINAASPNIALAWDFLKYLTTAEAQEGLSIFGIPINRNAFQTLVPESLEPYITYWIDQGALTGETDALINLAMEKIEQYNEMPMKYQMNLYQLPLLVMTREVLERFYLGTITPEQAAAELQNKVSLYLME